MSGGGGGGEVDKKVTNCDKGGGIKQKVEATHSKN